MDNNPPEADFGLLPNGIIGPTALWNERYKVTPIAMRSLQPATLIVLYGLITLFLVDTASDTPSKLSFWLPS
jgi:hypothetical protein